MSDEARRFRAAMSDPGPRKGKPVTPAGVVVSGLVVLSHTGGWVHVLGSEMFTDAAQVDAFLAALRRERLAVWPERLPLWRRLLAWWG